MKACITQYEINICVIQSIISIMIGLIFIHENHLF
jgi:hypothetical protein